MHRGEAGAEALTDRRAGASIVIAAGGGAAMPDVLVRKVPKKTLDALKRRAARAGRSLQQELRLALLRMGEETRGDYVERARQMREELLKRGRAWSDSAEIIRRARQCREAPL